MSMPFLDINKVNYSIINLWSRHMNSEAMLLSDYWLLVNSFPTKKTNRYDSKTI